MRMGKGSAEHNTHLHEAEHIDNERTDKNIYWTYKHGFTEKENLIKDEALFYEENYTEYLNNQTEKYKKRRQYAKIKTMEEYQKATPLDEMILQIGKMEETVDPQILKSVTDEFIKELEKKYGKHVHVVSYVIHLDEATPHVHLRLAYDYINKDNIKQYGIDKALTALGFKKPEKEFKTVKDKDGNEIQIEAKEHRFNNKKITFTDKIRSIFYDLCDLHLLDKGYDLINRTVENPSHRHLKTELYKAKKQKEANAKLNIENDNLKVSIEEAKQELEDIKKKYSSTQNENDVLSNENTQLSEDIEQAQQELRLLETKNEKLRGDINRKINKYEACKNLLIEAERKDLELVGESAITEPLDELLKNAREVYERFDI